MQRDLCLQSPHDERSDLSNSLEISMDRHYAHAMVQRSLGNQQVRDRSAVPHSVMMCQIPL